MASKFMWWWYFFLEFIDIPLHIRRKQFIGKKMRGTISIERGKAVDPSDYDYGVCSKVWRNYNPFRYWKQKMPLSFYLYELDGNLRTLYGEIIK